MTTVYVVRHMRGGARSWGEDSFLSPNMCVARATAPQGGMARNSDTPSHLGVRSPSANGLRRMPKVAPLAQTRTCKICGRFVIYEPEVSQNSRISRYARRLEYLPTSAIEQKCVRKNPLLFHIQKNNWGAKRKRNTAKEGFSEEVPSGCEAGR